MTATDKNKTFATLLALLLGGIGAHRFYLHGRQDRWGWLHLAAALASTLAVARLPAQPLLFSACLLVMSSLAGFVEALVIGLTPDEKWNKYFRPQTPSQSHWPLALLLVATLAIGATSLIATIARLFDLLYTGGAYG